MRRKNYGYQLIENSPWVLYTTISVMSLMIGNIMYMSKYQEGGILISISLFTLIINLSYWWGEVIKEGTIRGEHTRIVQEGLKKGFILFVISELCIFLTLFYSFLYSSIIPGTDVGGIWPPIGIRTIEYKSIPLLNTALLFFSGLTITAGQYYIKAGKEKESKRYIEYTLILGSIFVLFQYIEYSYSLFTISDSIFGSLFFSLTGFHGLHVLMGLFFILIAYRRLSHSSLSHHLNFVFSAIYYHFVDIIWIFLFALLYIWSSGLL